MYDLLRVDQLHLGYGKSQILKGVSLSVGSGSVTALFGRNGVGKTTLVHGICGLLHVRSGSIRLQGREVAGEPAHVIARAGVALVPQGRRVYASLTVRENLGLSLRTRSQGERAARLASVYERLPVLREKAGARGNQLSGGEQQMVAIGRALAAEPVLMVLDEPSEGLAPLMVERLMGIIRGLSEEGIGILLVEQNFYAGLSVADTVCILDSGQIIFSASPEEVSEQSERIQALLGVKMRSA